LAIYIDFVTAPYAAPVNSLAMLFFYSGLVVTEKEAPQKKDCREIVPGSLQCVLNVKKDVKN